jgi:hypothetical protein
MHPQIQVSVLLSLFSVWNTNLRLAHKELYFKLMPSRGNHVHLRINLIGDDCSSKGETTNVCGILVLKLLGLLPLGNWKVIRIGFNDGGL